MRAEAERNEQVSTLPQATDSVSTMLSPGGLRGAEPLGKCIRRGSAGGDCLPSSDVFSCISDLRGPDRRGQTVRVQIPSPF